MKGLKQKLKTSKQVYKLYGNLRVLCHRFRDAFLIQPKKLKELKDSYNGESCFIVATGPSLTLQDLELLKGYYSFSCNSIISCFDKTTWRPDFYSICDKEIFELYADAVGTLNIPYVFYPKDFKNSSEKDCIQFERSFAQHLKGIYYNSFSKIVYPSKKPNKYFCDATSVVFICIQIATYLGFKTIYLLGQDCNYSSNVLHSEIAESNYKGTVHKNAGDTMIQCFENYKEFYDSLGVKIYNCTRGGKLEVFPRTSLEDALLNIDGRKRNG